MTIDVDKYCKDNIYFFNSLFDRLTVGLCGEGLSIFEVEINKTWILYKLFYTERVEFRDRLRFMVYNATLKTIFQSYHRPVASHWQTLSHNVASSTPHVNGIWTSVAIGADDQVVVNPTTIRSRQRRPQFKQWDK